MKGIFVIFCVIVYSITAQNYQTVNSGRTQFYGSPGIITNSIRIDSAFYNGDSVLYSFKNILNDKTGGTYNIDKSSWIGKKIIKKKDGTNIFFNCNDDSVRIETTARKGDQWLAYSRYDTLFIYAKILREELNFFLGCPIQ
jgi:hypothetical protein